MSRWSRSQQPVYVEPPPEPSPIDRLRVLNDVEDFIRRFVVITDNQSTVLTLWVAHTWCIEAANCTPYMAITSETKRCGKTRLLETLELLVRNPLRSISITDAALVRALDARAVTLLLDEVDAIFGGGKSKEGLRAILNGGYRRGAKVHRIGGTHDAFSAKALAGIGRTLPDTVADRSIPIHLKRRKRDEEVERFRQSEAQEQVRVLRERLSCGFSLFEGGGETWRDPPEVDECSWTGVLKMLRPVLPDWLNDRSQDSWEPLFAIAEAVGGEWTNRALRASVELGKISLSDN